MTNENFMLKISKILKRKGKLPFWKNKKHWIHNEDLQIMALYTLLSTIFAICFLAFTGSFN
mgnify:FL=1